VIRVDIANQQNALPLDRRKLRRAVRATLEHESIPHATISLAFVDDKTIRDLNRKYLDHDRATDVLSFLLERDAVTFEGEIIVSAETACTVAMALGWPAEFELLLYVVHGLLHLLGYADRTPGERAAMQARESFYLEHFGMQRPNTVPRGSRRGKLSRENKGWHA